MSIVSVLGPRGTSVTSYRHPGLHSKTLSKGKESEASLEGIVKVLTTPLFRDNHFGLFSSHLFSVRISALTEHHMRIHVYIGVCLWAYYSPARWFRFILQAHCDVISYYLETRMSLACSPVCVKHYFISWFQFVTIRSNTVMNILEHKSLSVFLLSAEDKFLWVGFQSYTAFWEEAGAFQGRMSRYIDLRFFF